MAPTLRAYLRRLWRRCLAASYLHHPHPGAAVPNTGTDAMRATSPLTESDFLDIVDRAERALLGDWQATREVVGFDMIRLLAGHRDDQREIERLKHEVDYWMNLDAAALEAENERLRGQLAEALREVDRLLIDNAELSTECDQWQKKLAETWAELAALAALREPGERQ
jgi:regulator of replication initiation timing